MAPLAAATRLEFAGCLYAPGQDAALGLALDRAENVYVTGFTESPLFPTPDGFQKQLKGQSDAFVAKINATGTVLASASFLGGSSADAGVGIAVDSGGHAYVTRCASSALDFPTKNPLLQQQTFGGGASDGFITKIECDV